MFKRAELELILVVDHHHGVLIVVIGLGAGHAEHSSSVCSILQSLGVSGAVYSLNDPLTRSAFGIAAEWIVSAVLQIVLQYTNVYFELLAYHKPDNGKPI